MISGTSSAPANGAIAKEMPPLPVVPPDLYGSSSSFSSDAGKWEESLKKVVPAIVVIRVCLCSAFDGDRASYSHATGFVVDKVRGIILTNRHVVTPGMATWPEHSSSSSRVESFLCLSGCLLLLLLAAGVGMIQQHYVRTGVVRGLVVRYTKLLFVCVFRCCCFPPTFPVSRYNEALLLALLLLLLLLLYE